MAAFEYSALNSGGKMKRGTLEGDTTRQVRQLLRDQGLVPVSVNIISGDGPKNTPNRGRRSRSISATDLALITRQLATLIRSGTVLEEALRAVGDQTEKNNLRSIIAAVRSKVLEGHGMASALAEFPAVFSDLYRATVEAGEHSGHIDIVFERLADYTEFRHQIRQKIILALIYPALLTIVAAVVVTGLLAFVVPQVVSVFENVGQQLPLLTRLLIMISETIKENGTLMTVTCGGVLFVFNLLLKRPSFCLLTDELLLKIPLVGRFIKTLNSARFARSFSILTASGVSVVEGMRLSAQVLTNRPMRRAVEEAARRVREGESIHMTLAKSGFFPPISIHLIASGEASAQLEEMLEKAAQTQEKEIETLIAAAMSIFEPVLILVMGMVVLTIVLAILLPILDMNQLVR